MTTDVIASLGLVVKTDGIKKGTKRLSGLEKQAKRTEAQARQLKTAFAALGGVLGGLATTELFRLFNEQARSIAKVEQAIISTSQAAGFGAGELKKVAGELQAITLFGDEQILNGVTAQLLTFTNIAQDEFLRTQKVALDLSTVLDGDLKSASIQLGKALNDPVKNLSALSRSGIQFSESQTQTIKTLAQTNQLAEAQGLILEELERQYGGQAEAAAAIGTGALKQLQNVVGDIGELLGQDLFNAIEGPVKALKDFLAIDENQVKVVNTIKGVVTALGAAIATVFAPGIITAFGAALAALATPVAAIAAAVGGIIVFRDEIVQFAFGVETASEAIQMLFSSSIIQGLRDALGGVLRWVRDRAVELADAFNLTDKTIQRLRNLLPDVGGIQVRYNLDVDEASIETVERQAKIVEQRISKLAFQDIELNSRTAPQRNGLFLRTNSEEVDKIRKELTDLVSLSERLENELQTRIRWDLDVDNAPIELLKQQEQLVKSSVSSINEAIATVQNPDELEVLNDEFRKAAGFANKIAEELESRKQEAQNLKRGISDTADEATNVGKSLAAGISNDAIMALEKIQEEIEKLRVDQEILLAPDDVSAEQIRLLDQFQDYYKSIGAEARNVSRAQAEELVSLRNTNKALEQRKKLAEEIAAQEELIVAASISDRELAIAQEVLNLQRENTQLRTEDARILAEQLVLLDDQLFAIQEQRALLQAPFDNLAVNLEDAIVSGGTDGVDGLRDVFDNFLNDLKENFLRVLFRPLTQQLSGLLSSAVGSFSSVSTTGFGFNVLPQTAINSATLGVQQTGPVQDISVNRQTTAETTGQRQFVSAVDSLSGTIGSLGLAFAASNESTQNALITQLAIGAGASAIVGGIGSQVFNRTKKEANEAADSFLGRFDVPANDRSKIANPFVENAARNASEQAKEESFFGNFSVSLPSLIAGSIGTAVGSSLFGSSIESQIGSGVIGAVGGALGKSLGGTLGSILGPIGSAVGSILGSFAGSLFAGPVSAEGVNAVFRLDGSGSTDFGQKRDTDESNRNRGILEQIVSSTDEVNRLILDLVGGRIRGGVSGANANFLNINVDNNGISVGFQGDDGRPFEPEVFAPTEQGAQDAVAEAVRLTLSQLQGGNKTLSTVATALAEANAPLEDLVGVLEFLDQILASAEPPVSEYGQAIDELNRVFDSAIAKTRDNAKAEKELIKARDLALKTLRDQFLSDINDRILSVKDPVQFELQNLGKDISSVLIDAVDLGVNLNNPLNPVFRSISLDIQQFIDDLVSSGIAFTEILSQFDVIEKTLIDLGVDAKVVTASLARAYDRQTELFNEQVAGDIDQFLDGPLDQLERLLEAQDERAKAAEQLGADLDQVSRLSALELRAFFDGLSDEAIQEVESFLGLFNEASATIRENLDFSRQELEQRQSDFLQFAQDFAQLNTDLRSDFQVASPRESIGIQRARATELLVEIGRGNESAAAALPQVIQNLVDDARSIFGNTSEFQDILEFSQNTALEAEQAALQVASDTERQIQALDTSNDLLVEIRDILESTEAFTALLTAGPASSEELLSLITDGLGLTPKAANDNAAQLVGSTLLGNGFELVFADAVKSSLRPLVDTLAQLSTSLTDLPSLQRLTIEAIDRGSERVEDSIRDLDERMDRMEVLARAQLTELKNLNRAA
ncbi:MAG: hypothetical protein AAF720_00900 [Pseudomonadota bacterium]